jgi:hypothetical protein
VSYFGGEAELGGDLLERLAATFEAPLSFDGVRLRPDGGDVYIDLARYVLGADGYLVPAVNLPGSPPPTETDVWAIVGEGEYMSPTCTGGHLGSCMSVVRVRRILRAYLRRPEAAHVVMQSPRRVLRVPRPTR